MRKISAIIEKGTDGNYAVFLQKIDGLYGAGTTEQEAKNELMEAIDAAIEYANETNDWTDYSPLKGDFEIIYKYDLSGFFKTYDFFDVSALARFIGLNPSLLRRYKSGITKASDTTKAKIETGIHDIAKKLSMAQF